MALGGPKLPMYAASASASKPRLRAGSIHHRHDPPRLSPPVPPPAPPSAIQLVDYSPYLPPPSPTYRSRGRRWRYWPSFLTKWYAAILPFLRCRAIRTLLKLLLPALFCAFLIILFCYEPHIELAFYSRTWIKQEVEPVPALAGCFAPLRVSPRYNLSEAVYGKRRYEVQGGLPMRMGLDCYNFAGTIQLHRDDVLTRLSRSWVPPESRTQFHTYWRTDLVPFGVRQEWMIKSFFATQDIGGSRLVIWSNGDLSGNDILKRYMNKYPDSFALKVVDISSLARGTALQGSELLKLRDSKAWLDGDLVRLLLLWNYGGIWVDMDSLLTRDLTPLLEHEFVHQWDCYDKPYQALNGALMRFRQHSPYLCEALHIIASSPSPRKDTTDWGSLLYLKLYRRLIAASIPPFKVLPFCFFDGRSCRLDNRLPDPFVADPSRGLWTMGLGVHEGGGLDDVLSKVFGVHLHNQWEKVFPSGGWVERLLLRRYEERLKVTGLEPRSLPEERELEVEDARVPEPPTQELEVEVDAGS